MVQYAYITLYYNFEQTSTKKGNYPVEIVLWERKCEMVRICKSGKVSEILTVRIDFVPKIVYIRSNGTRRCEMAGYLRRDAGALKGNVHDHK